MKIVIIAHFTRDFSPSDNGRFLYLAKRLSRDHEVELITSSFNHGRKAQRIINPDIYPFKITQIFEPGYSKNVSIKRIASHHQWGKGLKAYLNTIETPDVIYCAVPSLTGPSYVARFCEQKGIRFVVDIQDLWPEAFEMVLGRSALSRAVFFPMRKEADAIYRRADEVCAVSRTYADRALSVNQNLSRGTVVYLGTDFDTFDCYAEAGSRQAHDGEVWLGYCGTLGSSYDLICVFDALAILLERGITPPKFIVLGDGPRRHEFEAYASSRSLDVLFTGRLPYPEMCGWLASCDIAVNPMAKNAAQSIINKHGDYAAAGLPVVNNQQNPEYRELVDSYQMGFNCENGNAADMADKLLKLIGDKQMRCTMGANARRCGEDRFDRKRSYSALIDALLKQS